MTAAGYLVNHPGGLSGERGVFYDYILAADGLYLRARSPLLEATIRIVEAEVRGLAPIDEEVELVHGKVPAGTGNLALSVLEACLHKEKYLALTWEQGAYHVREPRQDSTGCSVTYASVPNTVIDMHSHGAMSAFFSSTDNRDDQGIGIYAVVGDLYSAIPEAVLRVGIFGYFKMIAWEDIFEL